MRMRTGKTWIIVCSLALVVAACLPAFAGSAKVEFPQKGRAVIIIVPKAPGGINDMTARLVAPVLEKELGTPVQVVNKPGGATLTGLTEGRPGETGWPHRCRARASGNLTSYLDPDRQAVPQVRELQPVAAQNLDVGAVVVNAESPYRTLKELVDAAKAKPGSLKSRHRRPHGL